MCKVMSMFGSTYQGEQLFSLMNGNKSPVLDRDVGCQGIHLGSVLKVT